MKIIQSSLFALAGLCIVGCDSGVDFEDDLLAAKGERVVYVDWEERPEQLWDKSVEAPFVLTTRSSEDQIAIYGLDVANGTLEFAFIAKLESYADVRRAIEKRAVVQNFGLGFNHLVVPGRHTGGPPIPSTGPGGGDDVPASIQQLTIETGLIMQKHMNAYGDEHSLIFGDKK